MICIFIDRRDELADLLEIIEFEEVLKDGDYSIQVSRLLIH